MIKVSGTQTEALIYSDSPQLTAIEQIEELCNQAFLKDAKIRIMPDYHAGKGCVIGTTIELTDKVVANLVGVDVGCGVKVVQLDDRSIDFNQLDQIIRQFVPSGIELHSEETVGSVKEEFPESADFKAGHILNNDRSRFSLGTLGGGNHFIEVSRDEDGRHYLLIHTGSRYVGAKIAQHYQKLAFDSLNRNGISDIIAQLKLENRHSEIQSAIKRFGDEHPPIPKDLAYLEGQAFHDYIHDMKLAQQYALANRNQIAETILSRMNLTQAGSFDSIHNYIDTENMILRKGATSAQKGEQLVIPINMRDGSILATGKGNSEWNYSAPHGAGRVMSRTQASNTLNLEDFTATMKDVWTSSVSLETLDEAPMAYKPLEEIMGQIGETVEVSKIIKPVYNFKASDKFVRR